MTTIMNEREDDLLDTTRRYPRTLTGCNAAFPADPQYANPITHVGPSLMARVIDVACWVIGIAAVVFLFGAAVLMDGGR